MPKEKEEKDKGASGSSTAPNVDEFKKGDTLYCYHGPVPYLAKILEVKKERMGKHKSTGESVLMPYKVHYQGWNVRHDEWVPLDRVMPENEENARIAHQKFEQMEEEQAGGKKRKKTLSSTPGQRAGGGDVKEEEKESNRSTPSRDSKPPKSSRASVVSDQALPTSSNEHSVTAEKEEVKPGRGRRSKVGTTKKKEKTVETAKEYSSRPEVKIPIPSELKQMLVDDWDQIGRLYKLVRIPSHPTVDELVEEYKTEKDADTTLTPFDKEMLKESAEGIKSHFNAMLGTQLLYKFERPQYADMLDRDKEGERKRKKEAKGEEEELEGPDHSARYGYIHLLRLFVRIGTMLAHTSWSESTIEVIVKHIHDFVSFLEDKKHYFKPDVYDNTHLDYQKRVWH